VELAPPPPPKENELEKVAELNEKP